MLNVKPVVKVDQKRKAVNVTTAMFRLSFPQVFEPKPFMENGQPKGDPKYSLTMLFPKKSDIKWLRKAVDDAKKMHFGTKIPKNFRDPIKDGDEIADDKAAEGNENYDSYRGHWVVTASTGEKRQPQVIDRNKNEVIEKELYGGCWARATLSVKGYVAGANKGVTCYLGNIQKLKDDSRFGGGSSADQDFETVESDEDDESNYEQETEAEEGEEYEF